MMKKYSFFALALLCAAGCTPTIKTQNEVTIKPIQLTLDINLKVDQALAEAMNESGKSSASGTERRERMKLRRAKLDLWKQEKRIGEANTGLLELRTDPAKVSGELMLLLAEENNDRNAVFQAVAARQNVTPEVVGRRFAARIAERANAGTLRQMPDGSWITVE